MNNEHLPDEQLQEILDTRVLRSAPVLPLHLGNCAACQERLERFRRLYTGLAFDPGFTLPDGFADSVLDRIPVSHLSLFRNPIVPIILVCAAGTLTLLGLTIFVDMSPLTSGTIHIFNTLGKNIRLLAGQFNGFFSWLGGNAKPFIYGGLGLLGASLVDRLLRHQFMNHSH
jgi:hypothetical protein